MHLVGPHVVGHFGQWHNPRFSAHHPVVAVFVKNLAPRSVDLMDAVLIPEGAARSRRGRPVAEVPIGEACLFDEAVGHIDSEAVHAPVEPETEHTIKEAPDFGVFPVEIGLALIKNVEIPLARGSIGVSDS